VTPLLANKIEHTLHTLGTCAEWKHILDSIRSGFDVGADTAIATTIMYPNHNSTLHDLISSHVTLRPSKLPAGIPAHSHLSNSRPLWAHTILPLLGWSKLGSLSTWQLIQDFLFLRNPGAVQHTSVNLLINSDNYLTEWGTFVDTSALVLLLPDGCLAATFNVSATYRTTPVAPAQQNALCILWMGLLYIDFALAFGLASSTGIFGWAADMIVVIYITLGFGPMLKWVDDVFVIRLPGQVWTKGDFHAVGDTLGVPLS
jgi:hypothetical protein